MPLILLGFIFVVGLFIFYLFSTGSGKKDDSDQNTRSLKNKEDLEQEENIIFLPNDIERAKKQHRKNKF